jgi:hypothetical protein
LKPHSPTAAALPPRPLTSPPRPYKRCRTPPPPSPQPFAIVLIISLNSKLRACEKKSSPICFSAASLPPSQHRPPKPRVAFTSLPSPSFSTHGELSEAVAFGSESSGELLSLRRHESTMDRSPAASPLLCELDSPVFLMKNKSYILFNLQVLHQSPYCLYKFQSSPRFSIYI